MTNHGEPGSMARNGVHLAWREAHCPRRPKRSVENAQFGLSRPNCEGAGEQPNTAHGPYCSAKLTMKPPCVPTASWQRARAAAAVAANERNAGVLALTIT